MDWCDTFIQILMGCSTGTVAILPLSQCLWCINILRPRQNGRHFADDTFKYIFLNENVIISAKIPLTFVPEVPINNIPALVQIIVGADQATRHYLNQWWLDYQRIYASLGLNELKHRCTDCQLYIVRWLGTLKEYQVIHYNMTVWILMGNGINFSTAAGLIRQHMPSVK